MRIFGFTISAGMIFLTMSLLPCGTMSQQPSKRFTHADTLRGSITPGRAWWDVKFYDLHVRVNPGDSSISGWNTITYKVLKKSKLMQIDLMEPLLIDSIIHRRRRLDFRRDGNSFFVSLPSPEKKNSMGAVAVYYHGKPVIAKNPPWTGGLIWQRDSLGNPFISTACQTVGASIWWPCKDIEADEPDSQRIAITVPEELTDVSNGRLRARTPNGDGTTTFEWFVQDPINNYDVSINAGKYAHYHETYDGESGPLDLDFWPLAYNLDKAKTQFQQVRPMLKCFEHWFGPYPWYEDGYKLVEAPYSGMEHQSAVTYGNGYRNGYRGRDVSGSGWGYKFDFIIVHESAHEWFGNNITYKDIADMWIHESFANYAENLYVESLFGKEAGEAYLLGTRHVQNDRPVIGHYGVHEEGSGDMYNKGGSMLHMMRRIVGDDGKWRSVLRGLNREFWHQTVTSRQIWTFINKTSGVDFSKVFLQYLTTTLIPEFQYFIRGTTLHYRWSNVVKNFNMPLMIAFSGSEFRTIYPKGNWKTMKIPEGSSLHVHPDYFVNVQQLPGSPN